MGLCGSLGGDNRVTTRRLHCACAGPLLSGVNAELRRMLLCFEVPKAPRPTGKEGGKPILFASWTPHCGLSQCLF